MTKLFLLTREPERNIVDMKTRFKDYPVRFVSIPLIEIVHSFQWSFERAEELEGYSWIFFVSPSSVNAFFETLEEYRKIDLSIASKIERILKFKYFAVVGPFTGKELMKYGYKIGFIPSKAYGKKLIDEWKNIYPNETRPLWIIGNKGNIKNYAKYGNYWQMYKNQCPFGSLEKLRKYMEKNIITDYFVSSPSIWSRFFYVMKDFPDYPPIDYYVLGNTTYEAIQRDLGKCANIKVI